MLEGISTCIWFDNQANEAVLFYKDVFGAVEIQSENPHVVNYTLYGRRFLHLNGGPTFQVNPSISFMISGESEAEIQSIWDELMIGGKVLMPLTNYPFSKLYGWCSDKYGVNWQIMLGHERSCKVMPHLMFNGSNNGKANEAITFYSNIFKESFKIIKISKYEKGEADTEGSIKYSQFEISNLPFGAMDSSAPHEFNFNEGVSIMLTVDTQDEIDYYWDGLCQDGGVPGRCGWLKDKYGVSWQVVPTALSKLMNSRENALKVTSAFLKMSKFVIEDLEKAVL